MNETLYDIELDIPQQEIQPQPDSQLESPRRLPLCLLIIFVLL
jgi:hypothetical protein